MQLSTSTFPLDPSLAAAPAAGSTVAPVLGAATDGDTPAFSTLLFPSEAIAATPCVDSAPGSSLFSTPTAAASDSFVDGETVPTAETEQEAIAAWLAANGFPPPAATIVVVAPELLTAEAAADAVPGETIPAANASTWEAAPVDVTHRMPAPAVAATGVAEERAAVVSVRALRDVPRTAPEVSSASDATRVASSETTLETVAPSVARPSHAGDAIAAYQASAGPVAGDASTEKSRARPNTSASDTALPRRDPFSFVGVDRAMPAPVADTRTQVAQPDANRAEPALSAPDAAAFEELAEGAAVTLTPANVPHRDRPRAGARIVSAQGVIAMPSASTEPAAAARASAGTEKFAVAAVESEDEAANGSFRAEKKSLNTVDKELVGRSSGFGINAAKTENLMSASATSTAPSTATVELERVLPVPATFETLFTEPEQTTTTLVHAARRSVESALNVAEQFASGDKRAVTLQFSVSGVDLGVRVELRGDGVHTTFRTDSPELRAALAQEWQSVAGGQGSDRSARFVDPVFTAASPGNSQQGDASAGHRDSQARQDRQMADDLAAIQVAPRIKNQTGVSPAPAALSRGTSISTSSRLHTFA